MLLGYQIAAVCISRIHEEVLRDFIAAFSKTLAANGWRTLIFTTSSDLYHATPSSVGEAAIFQLIDPQILDALVIFGDKIQNEECVSRLITLGNAYAIPTFMVNGHHAGCHAINFNHAEGFSTVIRHLIEVHNIRSFHMIAGMKDNDYSDARINAFRGVLAEYNIPFNLQKDVSYGDFWSMPATQAVKKLIEENRLPHAIVCANDIMAIAVTVELRRQGYRVPEDIIVTGFDGVDDINFTIPKLTSAFCNYSELGKRTAELCIKAGYGGEMPEETLLIPKIIVQESCGCNQMQDIDQIGCITRKNDIFYRYQDEFEHLGEISALIQSCNSFEEITEQLHDPIFYSVQCLIKRECTDLSLDPMMQHSGTAFGEEMYVLLDSNYPKSEGKMIPTRNLALRMDELLASGYPLIFTVLHHISLPIGYFVFTYQDCDYQNFLKIHQDALIIGSAIQGFRSRMYQKHLQKVVEESYMYDSLTGLLGRNAFLQCVKDLHTVTFEPYTLVLADLDGLKYINDHFSHAEGDNAIFIAATALHEICRELCCRYGGDEMIALLNYGADEAKLRQDILDYLKRYNDKSGKPYEVSVSIGIYTSSDDDFDTMLKKADALMYQDKATKPHRHKEA